MCMHQNVYACMHVSVHVVLCSIIPASFRVKLEFCIALSRAQGCLQLCELCQIQLYRDRVLRCHALRICLITDMVSGG